MKKIYIIGAGLLLAALFLFLFLNNDATVTVSDTQNGTDTPVEDEQSLNSLMVPEFGLSLEYKGGDAGYVLVEQEEDQRGDLVYAASLYDASDHAAFLRNDAAGEGPVSLHIAVYRNPMNLSPIEWVEQTPESNFSLSMDGTHSEAVFGFMRYLRYSWDGLYRADAYVVGQEGYMYVFTNQWMDEASIMRKDMEEVIASVSLSTPQLPASVAHGDIRVTSPQPGESVSSPIRITGEARGYWFFEASFPVTIVDWDGIILAEGIATADGDWMTESFVPFTAEVEYSEPSVPDFNTRGAIILKKDNPSGLPENDDAIEIPITFR